MAPLQSIYYFYQSAVENIAPSCTVFEIFDIEEYREFEI